MPASPASYALLGLPPGATRAAVDRAYRALMKRHHPDLGGDPERAASINRAYADITRPADSAPAQTPSDLAAALYQRHQAQRRSARAIRRKPRRWPRWLLLGAVLAGLAWAGREPLANLVWDLKWRYFPPVGQTGVAGDALASGGGLARGALATAPLDPAVIAAAEAMARQNIASGGMGAAAEASRRCFIAFHALPTLAGYDRCVAFDNAVLLIGGFGIADRGGFSAGAVTARQIEAARTLDGNYENIEARIDRIRLAMIHRLQDREI